jgi:phosphotransferase system, enzyme I, PtsP
VSVAVARTEPHYKHIRGLGEEAYPSFLAVPILSGPRAIGVLVLQRRATHAFTPREVVLATALAAPLASAIDAAERRARARAADTGGSRVARLRGVPVSGGVAMGRIAVVPTLTALADQWSRRDGSAQAPPLADALGRLERDFDKARRQLRGDRDPSAQRALTNLELVLADHRFREQVVEGCLRDGLVAGLAGVARDYARVPYRVPARDASMTALLAERSREVEDLCVMLYGLATGERFLQPGRIWATDRLGSFLALCAVARSAGAVVVDGDAATRCPGAAITRAGDIPVVAEVTGLFSWARPGDLLVVDGDGGGVRVNPASASVARFRKERRARD